MGNVGLLLVGSVLFVNGLATLGLLSSRSGAPLNLLVGLAQVVLPTLIIAQSQGDLAIINSAWPSYLFGFTYLWWGVIGLTGIEPEGFGWYSLFVVLIALYQAIRVLATDPISSAMWFTWALMWGMFFVLLGVRVVAVGRLDLNRFTGWLLVLLGIPSCVPTAILAMNEGWSTTALAGGTAFGILILGIILSALFSVTRRESKPASSTVVPAASESAS